MALATTGRFQWSKVWYYIVAQMIGFFVGAAIVFAVYYGKWIEVDPAFENTAGVFATFPAVPGFLYGFIDSGCRYISFDVYDTCYRRCK